MRIVKMLGNTRQYLLDDGRAVGIDDYHAGRVQALRPVRAPEPVEEPAKKKRGRW